MLRFCAVLKGARPRRRFSRTTMHLPRLLPAVLSLVFTCQVRAADDYQLGPDSLPQPGVPAGKEEKLALPTSSIFPGADL